MTAADSRAAPEGLRLDAAVAVYYSDSATVLLKCRSTYFLGETKEGRRVILCIGYYFHEIVGSMEDHGTFERDHPR